MYATPRFCTIALPPRPACSRASFGLHLRAALIRCARFPPRLDTLSNVARGNSPNPVFDFDTFHFEKKPRYLDGIKRHPGSEATQGKARVLKVYHSTSQKGNIS